MKPTPYNESNLDDTLSPDSDVVRGHQQTAIRLGAVAVLTGAVILAGWVMEIPALKGLFPVQAETKANSALCFILLGFGLMLKMWSWRQPGSRGYHRLFAGLCAGGAAAIGVLTLLQYLTGRSLGLDQMLVVEAAGDADSIHPGRMAVSTALTFVLLGTALLCLDWVRERMVLLVAVLPGAAIAGLAFIGQLYDFPIVSFLGPLVPVAAPTSLISLLLSLGILYGGGSRFIVRIRRSASTVGFAAALLLLGIMAGAVVHTTRGLIRANQWVTHTQQVIAKLGEVLAGMQDAEVSLRGYLLTADPDFLKAYHPTPARVSEDLRELGELTADNPSQRERLGRLQAAIAARLARASDQVQLLERNLAGTGTAVETAEEGDRMMTEVKRNVEEMTREERRLLADRREQIEVSTRKTMITLALGTGVSVFLLYSVVGLLRSEVRRRTAVMTALRSSEENLAVTLNSIGDAVLATDTAGRITRMNQVAEQLTGWPAAEARGRPIAEVFRIINEATRQPGRIPVDDVLATGQVQELANHTALIARDGTERPIADSAAPIRDATGKIFGVVLVFRDVTAEYAARKAMEESERRYRMLFESIEQGFCILQLIFGPDGRAVDYRFLQINPAFEKQSGLKDVVGRTMREFAPNLEQEWFDTLGKVAVTGEPIRFENRAAALNRAYEIYAFRFGEAANRQVAVLFSDVTERHRAQEELNRFFKLSVDFLCISSADGSFKRVSPGITGILGWTVEEFMAMPYLEQVHPDDRESTQRMVERQMQTGEKVLRFENRYRHKDGSWRTLSWRSAPHDGLMYATARDVTEARSREHEIQRLNQDLAHRASQLEVANKELEAFSYSVSHDLRAPLRHVQGYVEMLTREAGEGLSGKAQRYLKTIADAAREMGELIDDLLAFSRMGRSEMSQAEVDLTALVTEVRAGLQPGLNERAIQWMVNPLPRVKGDGAMLRQVLVNLIGNAAKYTRHRTPAEIEVGCAGMEQDEWVLFVRDNGAGFDMKYADKLFGVFQRLHRSDEFEGTGIGLASVRRIISRHGGRTWAEGQVGVGATFYFTLQPATPNQTGPAPLS